ncbi:hypothetical protein AB4Z50_35590 [Paenibacillus sp. 2TAB26]|uniref:imm11 family protein n=1 Tax=Paenibacillus sp. 2TAB26 TaxID=3233005 RepID=UPI003F9DBC0C
MKVWRLLYSSNATILMVKNDQLRIINFEGKIDDFTPIEMKVVKKGKYNDFYGFLPEIPIISLETKEFLSPFIKKSVQFLDFKLKQDICGLNVTNVIDCIDYDNSIIEDGSIIKIEFDKSKLEGQYIFKIPQHRMIAVYVTDALKDIIEKSPFKGYEFVEIWDSMNTGDEERERKLRYEEEIQRIENIEGKTYTWSEAYELVEQGKSVISSKWKIQRNKNGVIVLGDLLDALKYRWMEPMFWPPILFDLTWYETEKSDI